MKRQLLIAAAAGTLAALAATTPTTADPCGMVPPITLARHAAITRIGAQQTYVFFKDGVETFVIRPGFSGKTDEFGMLIPFPTPPSIRKVDDDIFGHIAAAADPPEVVIDLTKRKRRAPGAGFALGGGGRGLEVYAATRDRVRVIREEAVGMYQVAVLDAGSARALKGWMDRNGYRYPAGMDDVCDEYVADGWCFVAVKTQVGRKAAVDPRPGMRAADAALPPGFSFDGHVQAMGFRFEVDEPVVPMRLSVFNEGELRNIVYVLADRPVRIKGIPTGFVKAQISGPQLRRHLTAPLPLRIIGGTEKNLTERHRRDLPTQRDPVPHNGLARELFAADLLAAARGDLAHPFEELEKELLRIGERLGLRGTELDALHHAELATAREAALAEALGGLDGMTFTVIDGDFPRDVLARDNLRFERFVAQRAMIEPMAAPGRPAWPLVGLLGCGVLALAGRRGVAMITATSIAAVWLALASSAGATTTIAPTDDSPAAFARARSEIASVAQGMQPIAALRGIAREGTVVERGWAIVALVEIGGHDADAAILQLRDDDAQPALVRTWAGAARLTLARSATELIERSAYADPVLHELAGKRLVTLLAAGGTPPSARELLVMARRYPALGALGEAIVALGPDPLIAEMTSAPTAPLRRAAAGYLAAMPAHSGAAGAQVAARVIEAYRFRAGADDVPWAGGALFVPGLEWTEAEARELTRTLISWLVWSHHAGRDDVQQAILNNLRSVGLWRRAGLSQVGRDDVSWLRAWRDTKGRDDVVALLGEQRLHEHPRYRKILAGK